jgi:hypothetical protein
MTGRAAWLSSIGLAMALVAFLGGATAEAAGFRLEIGAGLVPSDYDLGLEGGIGPLDLEAQSDGGHRRLRPAVLGWAVGRRDALA